MAQLTQDADSNLITQAEHARRCGVSRVAVTKWRAAGKLVFVGEKVDHAASYKGENWHDGVKKSRQEPAAAAPAPKPDKAEKAAAEPPKTVAPPASPPAADAPQIGPAGSTALKDAVTRKEEFAGRLRELDYMQRAGQLIELEQARRVFFEEARAWRDAWTNWPMQVAALMAADLGIEADRLAEVLNTHVHRHLVQLGTPRGNLAQA